MAPFTEILGESSVSDTDTAAAGAVCCTNTSSLATSYINDRFGQVSTESAV
jgi:hypothetical protein